MRRHPGVVPVRCGGCVVPHAVYADVVGISDVSSSHTPGVVRPEVACGVSDPGGVWRRCVRADGHRVVISAAIAVADAEIHVIDARGCRPVPGAVGGAEIGEQVCAVAREGRRIAIGVCCIIVHIDVFTHLPAPVARVRDRDRVIRNPGVLRCASGGERAVCARVVCVDRDVLPCMGRVRCVVGCDGGSVCPDTVYADVEQISDVPGSCAPGVVHPEVPGRVLEVHRIRRRCVRGDRHRVI